MKIAFSLSPLTNDSKTRGVGVYTRELHANLVKHFPNDSFLTLKGSPYKQDVDLVHYPFFDPFYLTLPIIKSKPTVVTIHDCIPLRFSEHFPRGIRGELKFRLQRFSLAKVDHVITDSLASKADIVKYLDYSADMISVIPLGPATTRTTVTIKKSIIDEYNLPSRYLLYVGDINWNKNIPALIRAFNSLGSGRNHLVLVGKVFDDKPDIPEYREVIRLVESSPNRDKIHILGYVPSHHLPYIYKLATLYVQASWYEGFGLPILEAMYHGCPVLSSSAGSLPEVGGDAVEYFDPNKPKKLAKKLTELLSNSSKRRKLAKLGQTRAKEYTWEKTAKLTYDVYTSLLNK